MFKARGKHRCGLPSLATTLKTWKLVASRASPQHRRGDWPTQVQGQCQILPESEFSQGSTPHVIKWEEKISTSKTKLMESLCKDWRDVCLCVLGWVGGSIWWAEVQFCTFFLFIVANKQTLAVYTIQAQLHLCRLFKAKLKILLITV